ncbi:hypothetical protein [Litorihabitans aurantiacus]|uniref:hypothetical protein n=1 Tax=Litorihabitans aurantiacus TaxID=1930061 RepID=UPI0024E0A5C0|nr:hypothetical protein [Litorihabitans aurantiacus]
MHDDGHYREVSPLSHDADPLRAAIHGWARVLSTPEPHLAVLDAGKRDLSSDLGLPVPQLVHAADGGVRPLAGHVSALNDQHAFLRTPGEELAVGDVVRLGLSHPCTALDRWRLVPLIDDAAAERPAVTGAVETYF